MDTTVAKGMRLIELLAQADGSMRLSTIAEQLQLQKSNVHRLLSTFVELGFVYRSEETGRYALTLRLWELGTATIDRVPAKRAAGGFMQELHRTTSETVSLTVLEGDDVLYLDKILAPRPIRFTTRIGSRAPAALTASGKVLLAHEEDAREIVERTAAGLPEDKEPLDIEAVMNELEQIRREGYCVTKGSWTPALVSIAAPVMGRHGKPAAALAISGPAQRLRPERIGDVVESVLSTCARMAETVGPI